MTKSSKLFRLTLVPFSLLIVVLFSWSTMASAAPQTVSWSGPDNRSNTDDKSVYPSVAYDAQGFLHVIWLEYGSGESSRLMYTNNINGSFMSPFEVVNDAGKNVEHITGLAVESNRAHLFYTTEGKSLRHLVLNLSGANPSRGEATTISQGRGYAPSATVDNSGRVHAVWIDNRTGTYQVYHRIWSGGWEGTRSVRANGRSQDTPSIAATNDGRVHVLFTIDSNVLGYSVFDGNWNEATGPATEYGNISGLATDGNTLYAVWSNKPHRVFYAERSNGNWNNRMKISEGETWSDYPTITYSRGNNKLYAAWSAPSSPDSKIVVREISPGGQLNDIVTIGNTAPSTWARAVASSNEISILWQDKSSGAEEIRHVRAQAAVRATETPAPTETPIPTATPSPSPTPSPTPTPPPPSGSLELSDPSVQTGQDGALYTNQASVNAIIRHTGGSQPDQYGLSDGGDPGDPGQSFNGSEQTVQYSLNTSDDACRSHQVNARLQSSQWGISELFGDSITYDDAVKASVIARNPNLFSGAAVTDTTSVGAANFSESPANFGDPAYTKESFFHLSVQNEAGECSGVSRYIFEYTRLASGRTPPPAETISLPNAIETYELPANNRIQGRYTFEVTLNDNAGNTKTDGPFSITYDTIAPRVQLAGGTVVTRTEIADGYVMPDTSAVTVTDNLYEASNNRQYYGVWILVRRADRGEPSENDWQDKAVAVSGDISELRWNMAMGLVDTFVPGESYKMYIRYVDGAANVSDKVIETAPVQIDQFEGPRQMLPMVHTP